MNFFLAVHQLADRNLLERVNQWKTSAVKQFAPLLEEEATSQSFRGSSSRCCKEVSRASGGSSHFLRVPPVKGSFMNHPKKGEEIKSPTMCCVQIFHSNELLGMSQYAWPNKSRKIPRQIAPSSATGTTLEDTMGGWGRGRVKKDPFSSSFSGARVQLPQYSDIWLEWNKDGHVIVSSTPPSGLSNFLLPSSHPPLCSESSKSSTRTSSSISSTERVRLYPSSASAEKLPNRVPQLVAQAAKPPASTRNVPVSTSMKIDSTAFVPMGAENTNPIPYPVNETRTTTNMVQPSTTLADESNDPDEEDYDNFFSALITDKHPDYISILDGYYSQILY